jgi:SpoVK/Ycf46/Vps4 family AAA+-type ATPase
MTVNSDVNFEELARSTDEFNGAQLKAVCVEAGMIALREGATKLGHEHFLTGIAEGGEVCSHFIMLLTYSQQFKARRRTTSCTLHRRGPMDLGHV